jgi:hypothetical protein
MPTHSRSSTPQGGIPRTRFPRVFFVPRERASERESNGEVTRHLFTGHTQPWLSLELMVKFLSHAVGPHVFSSSKLVSGKGDAGLEAFDVSFERIPSVERLVGSKASTKGLVFMHDIAVREVPIEVLDGRGCWANVVRFRKTTVGRRRPLLIDMTDITPWRNPPVQEGSKSSGGVHYQPWGRPPVTTSPKPPAGQHQVSGRYFHFGITSFISGSVILSVSAHDG